MHAWLHTDSLFVVALYDYVLWHYTEKRAPSVNFLVSLLTMLIALGITVGTHVRLQTSNAYNRFDDSREQESADEVSLDRTPRLRPI